MRHVTWIRTAGVGMAVGALLLSGCQGAMKAKAAAAVAASKDFHRLYNANDLKQIYAQSDPGLKKVATEAEFLKVIGEIRTRLGKAKSSKNYKHQIIATSRGSFWEFTQDTEFEKGNGMEMFLFRIVRGKAQLDTYNVKFKIEDANTSQGGK